ncbi:MAG: DUF917 family protein [Stellaceae bacterium]
MDRDTLVSLSRDGLTALILAQGEVMARQAARIEALTARVAALTKQVEDLETKLGQPPKTPVNASLPPSRGHKPNRTERGPSARGGPLATGLDPVVDPRGAAKRKGHPGAFRALAAHPARVIESYAEVCPHCAQALAVAEQPGFHAYVDVARRTTEGYLRGRAVFEGLDEDRASRLEIAFQNEWVVAWKDGQPLVMSPDLICVLDTVSGESFGTETIAYGRRASVIALPAPAVFLTPKGLEHVGPRAFGYELDFRSVFNQD